MRRVIEFFEWKANWWVQQKDLRTNVSSEVADGLQAYAEKQAHMFRTMAGKFGAMWYSTLLKNGLDADWPNQYIPTQTIQPDDLMLDSDY
jgi:hypothetical protein